LLINLWCNLVLYNLISEILGCVVKLHIVKTDIDIDMNVTRLLHINICCTCTLMHININIDANDFILLIRSKLISFSMNKVT